MSRRLIVFDRVGKPQSAEEIAAPRVAPSFSCYKYVEITSTLDPPHTGSKIEKHWVGDNEIGLQP